MRFCLACGGRIAWDARRVRWLHFTPHDHAAMATAPATEEHMRRWRLGQESHLGEDDET